MNKEIMRKLGFSDMVDSVEKGVCPFCKETVHPENMNASDLKEYQISGLCSKCQKEMFG